MPSAAEEPLVRLYRGEPADLAPWAESQEPEHYQNCLRAISSRDEAALNDALEARFRSAGNTSPPRSSIYAARPASKSGPDMGSAAGWRLLNSPGCSWRRRTGRCPCRLFTMSSPPCCGNGQRTAGKCKRNRRPNGRRRFNHFSELRE